MGRISSSDKTSSKLKQEIEFFNCISLDEALIPIQESIKHMLEIELQDILQAEESLQQCGINMKISDESISKNIMRLKQKGNDVLDHNKRLEEQLKAKDDGSKADLEQALSNLKAELQIEKQDELDKLKLEGEEKIKKAMMESYS